MLSVFGGPHVSGRPTPEELAEALSLFSGAGRDPDVDEDSDEEDDGEWDGKKPLTMGVVNGRKGCACTTHPHDTTQKGV